MRYVRIFIMISSWRPAIPSMSTFYPQIDSKYVSLSYPLNMLATSLPTIWIGRFASQFLQFIDSVKSYKYWGIFLKNSSKFNDKFFCEVYQNFFKHICKNITNCFRNSSMSFFGNCASNPRIMHALSTKSAKNHRNTFAPEIIPKKICRETFSRITGKGEWIH